uniref:Uncharacterized protein n=1 Tax=Helianthus annuus TaxID=4232 RepID=A0A251V8L9_HELAN
MKNLEFCTYHSREAYGGGEGYLEAMHDLHGSNFIEVSDDPEALAMRTQLADIQARLEIDEGTG